MEPLKKRKDDEASATQPAKKTESPMKEPDAWYPEPGTSILNKL